MNRGYRNTSRWLAGAAFATAVAIGTPALAADECGVPSATGQVTCPATGNPYATGITYTSPGALSVNAPAGVATAGKISITSTGGTAALTGAANVATNATNTDGIDVTGAGDVSVTANTVSTGGTDSAGVIAISNSGSVSVTTQSVTVGAPGGAGILALGKGGVTIVSGAASSINNSAIFAQGNTGPVSLTVTGGNISSNTSDSAVVLVSGSTVAVNIAAGATVTGQDALTLNSQTGTTVTNAGTLTGTVSYAIFVSRAPATITNTGTLNGGVSLAGANNRLINNGTFTFDKFSLFGTGATSFTNNGTVQYLATAPTAVSFYGLATFSNGGTLSLANGRVGDVLTLPGTYAGGGGALVLDAGLGTAGVAADRLVVGGAATGSTAVVLVSSGGAPLISAGTVIVQAGAGSDPAAFHLASASSTAGFVQYNIAFDAVTNSFSLVATPAASAYLPVKFVEGARNIWYRSSDAWSARTRASRDAPDGIGRLWGEAYGATEGRHSGVSNTVFGQTAAVSLSYSQDYFGGQLGYDILQPTGDGGLTLGVTGGYVTSYLNFDDRITRGRYDTFNGGAYVGYHYGPFFANALGKYDHHRLQMDNLVPGLSLAINGQSYGVTGEAGLRATTGGFYFEPLVTLSYVRTDLDNFTALASTFDFRNATGLRGKAGGRIGTTHELPGGRTLTVYAGGNVVKEFDGRRGLVFTNNGTSLDFGNDRVPLYGEGYGGFEIRGARGITGLIEGFGNTGKDTALRGGGARVVISIAL